MTAEELDVCRNLQCSVERAFRSKRMLRILSQLNEKGLIELDVLGGKATLTAKGTLAVSSQHRAPQGE
jgi:hypothetical protein